MVESIKIRIPEGDYVEIQTKWVGKHGVRIPTDRREFIGPGCLIFIPDEDDDPQGNKEAVVKSPT